MKIVKIRVSCALLVMLLSMFSSLLSIDSEMASEADQITDPSKKNTDKNVRELRWNWDEIDTNDMSFPKNFMWGAAICEFQTSGAHCCPDSNWAHWEKNEELEPSGKVCDSWNLYHKDIAMLKELGLN